MQFQFGNMWSVYPKTSDLFLACGHSEVLANNCLSASVGVLSEAVEKLQGLDRILGRYIGPKPKKYLLIRTRQWEKGRKFGLYQVSDHDGEVDTDILYQSLRILRKFAEQNPDLRIDIESPTVYGLNLEKATRLLEPLPDNVYVWIPEDQDDDEDEGDDDGEIEELRPSRKLSDNVLTIEARQQLFDDVNAMYHESRGEEDPRCFHMESVLGAIPSRLFAEDVDKNYYRSLDVFEIYAVREEQVLFRFYCAAARSDFPAEIGQLLEVGDYLVSFQRTFAMTEKITAPFACTIEIVEQYIDGEVPTEGDEMPDTPPWDTHPAGWHKLDEPVEDVTPPETPTPTPQPEAQPKPKRTRTRKPKSQEVLEAILASKANEGK